MLKHYLSLALKVLMRRKFFTFISLFGISFTLLVLMVVAAMFDHAFAPMAPETRQNRTLAVHEAVMYGPHSTWQSSAGYKLLDTYARNLPGVERLSLYTGDRTVHSYVNGDKIESSLKRTDDEFWRILDFSFIEGGPYGTSDVAEARFVAVINATTRQRFFGGAPAAGQTIEADGQRFRVVGVVEDVSEVRRTAFAEIWVPYTTAKTDAYKREVMGDWNAMVLAKDAASLDGIHQEFNSRLLRVELPDPKTFQTIVAPFETKVDGFARMMPPGDSKNPDRPVGGLAVPVPAGVELRPFGRDDLADALTMVQELYGLDADADVERHRPAFESLVGDVDATPFLAVADGRPAGLIVHRLRRRLNHATFEGWISDLIVRAPFRGRGIGRSLVSAGTRRKPFPSPS